jgi:hypothetical protein
MFGSIQMMKRFQTILMLIFSFILVSCGSLILRDVSCKSIKSELESYAYRVGDTLSFEVSNGTIRKYVVVQKKATHTTEYTTDAGCLCYDFWDVIAVSNSDSIISFVQQQYHENQKVKRYETIQIRVDGIMSQFTDSVKTNIGDYRLDTITYKEVSKYDRNSNSPEDFKTVYYTAKYGIILIQKQNGENWKTQKWLDTAGAPLSTWDYEQTKCN